MKQNAPIQNCARSSSTCWLFAAAERRRLERFCCSLRLSCPKALFDLSSTVLLLKKSVFLGFFLPRPSHLPAHCFSTLGPPSVFLSSRFRHFLRSWCGLAFPFGKGLLPVCLVFLLTYLFYPLPHSFALSVPFTTPPCSVVTLSPPPPI